MNIRRLVIYNPVARGSRRQGIGQDIGQQLANAGLACELQITDSPQQATQIARHAAHCGYGQIIAAGGDGTVNAVINGMADSASALGIIPLGTANALAKNLGLPEGDISAAAAVIAQGHTRRIDLGMINGRYFAAMAGVGLDAQVAYEMGSGWKRRLGTMAFVGQALTTAIHYQPSHLCLQLDGEPSLDIAEPVWAVVICNFPLYTWRLRFVPQAQPDDGQLDVVVFHHCSLGQLLALAAHNFLRGQPVAENPHVTVTKAQQMQITSQPPCRWQVDGDVAGQTPVQVRIAPNKLNLITPVAD